MRLRDLSRQSTTPSAQRHISGQPGWAEHSSDGRSAAPKLTGNNNQQWIYMTIFFFFLFSVYIEYNSAEGQATNQRERERKRTDVHTKQNQRNNKNAHAHTTNRNLERNRQILLMEMGKKRNRGWKRNKTIWKTRGKTNNFQERAKGRRRKMKICSVCVKGERHCASRD